MTCQVLGMRTLEALGTSELSGRQYYMGPGSEVEEETWPSLTDRWRLQLWEHMRHQGHVPRTDSGVPLPQR